jgi:hypothetical protein
MAKITITPEFDFRPPYEIQAPNHMEARIQTWKDGTQFTDIYDGDGKSVCCTPTNGKVEIEYAD